MFQWYDIHPPYLFRDIPVESIATDIGASETSTSQGPEGKTLPSAPPTADASLHLSWNWVRLIPLNPFSSRKWLRDPDRKSVV